MFADAGVHAGGMRLWCVQSLGPKDRRQGMASQARPGPAPPRRPKGKARVVFILVVLVGVKW